MARGPPKLCQISRKSATKGWGWGQRPSIFLVWICCLQRRGWGLAWAPYSHRAPGFLVWHVTQVNIWLERILDSCTTHFDQVLPNKYSWNATCHLGLTTIFFCHKKLFTFSGSISSWVFGIVGVSLALALWAETLNDLESFSSNKTWLRSSWLSDFSLSMRIFLSSSQIFLHGVSKSALIRLANFNLNLCKIGFTLSFEQLCKSFFVMVTICNPFSLSSFVVIILKGHL